MLVDVNETRIYAYTGNRSPVTGQPAVVFLHGAANDHSVWSLQSRYFAWHGWNTYALDLPGHGKSSGKPVDNIEGLAKTVIDFFDAAGISCAAIIGHSMGSLIGLELAARFPERVTELAMIGTAVPMPVSDTLLKASAANDHAAYEMINAFAHSTRAKIGGNRVPGMWMLGNSMRLMERSADGVLYADFAACNGYQGGADAAAKVSCAVLLVLGQRDLMTPPRAAKDVSGKFAQVRTETLPGTGHSLMSEQPDAVLDSLIGFLSKKQTAAA